MLISIPYKKGLLNRTSSPKYKREMRIYEICPEGLGI
uniref:Transcriptional regulator binding protein.97A n=1 Tax=virus sp. ctE0n6 TaxID=2827985 RepID=A0A8S5RG78_9VIRU|nr:MAG TPA: Transcriptional regulator binding protein.97A [virus sp. ctE0n6]